MNRGPIHIAYGRVDEHDDTDFDCIDSVELSLGNMPALMPGGS